MSEPEEDECSVCGGSGEMEVCMQCRFEPDNCMCDPEMYADVEQEYDIADCHECDGTGYYGD